MRDRHVVGIGIMAALVLAATVVTASAADRVKVVARTATIRAAASATSAAVAVVAAGTVFDVLGRESGWYKVSVYAGGNRAVRPGYIDERSVVPTTERPVLVPLGPTAGGAAGGAAGGRPARHRLQAFGEGSFQAFTASNSFKALFGRSTGFFYGGGVHYTVGRLFTAVSVTHFRKAGQRAFVYNGETYQLGIEDRVAITPVTVNVGYRFSSPRRRYTPYVAAGGGAVIYRETSDNAAAGENVSKTGGAFEVLGGVEVPLSRLVAVAVEGQYQGIRGILGTNGVSQAFNEKDLGGASVRVKILFGR